MSKHPMQPLELVDKTIRFKENRIVKFLLKKYKDDLTKIWGMDFPMEDMVQFYQLIGYSAAGFGEVFCEMSPKVVEEIDEICESMIEERKKERGE